MFLFCILPVFKLLKSGLAVTTILLIFSGNSRDVLLWFCNAFILLLSFPSTLSFYKVLLHKRVSMCYILFSLLFAIFIYSTFDFPFKIFFRVFEVFIDGSLPFRHFVISNLLNLNFISNSSTDISNFVSICSISSLLMISYFSNIFRSYNTKICFS